MSKQFTKSYSGGVKVNFGKRKELAVTPFHGNIYLHFTEFLGKSSQDRNHKRFSMSMGEYSEISHLLVSEKLINVGQDLLLKSKALGKENMKRKPTSPLKGSPVKKILKTEFDEESDRMLTNLVLPEQQQPLTEQNVQLYQQRPQQQPPTEQNVQLYQQRPQQQQPPPPLTEQQEQPLTEQNVQQHQQQFYYPQPAASNYYFPSYQELWQPTTNYHCPVYQQEQQQWEQPM